MASATFDYPTSRPGLHRNPLSAAGDISVQGSPLSRRRRSPESVLALGIHIVERSSAARPRGGSHDIPVRRAEYFYTTVADEPGEALELLTLLGEKGISLLAFTAVPVGPNRTQLTIFPDDVAKTVSEAKKAQLPLDGPYAALLVQGKDALGALAAVHAEAL